MTESNTPTPAPEPQPMPTLMSAGDAEKAATKPKKRWKRILAWTGGILGALVLIVLLFGPMVIGPIVRSQVVAALNEKLDGTAELDEFSFGWTGNAVVGGLTVKDKAGEVVFSAKRVTVSASVMGALSGSYSADVVVEDPVVVVRQGADQRINLETLLKPEPVKASREPKEGRPKAEKDEKLPFVKATVAVKGGRISFFHRDGREARFNDVSAKVVVDTFDRPVTFEAALGAITAKGEVTIARAGKLDLDGLRGPVNVDLKNVSLAELLPVVAAYAPVTRLEGTLTGKVPCTLTSMTSANVGGALELRGFAIESPLLPEPVKLDAVRLTPEVVLDSAGTGTQKLRLSVGEFLEVVVDAKSEELLRETGVVTATVTVDGKLGGIAEAAGALFKLKQDYALGGVLKAKAEVRATRAQRVSATVDASLENLSVRDPNGQFLPVDPTATLGLKAEYDPVGLVKIERCDAKAGTIVITARGGVDINKRSFSDSILKIDADLDDVARKVASFIDLGFSFGGKVHIDAKLEGTGEVARATSTVIVSQLRLLGFQGKDLGPIDLTLDQTGMVDLRPGAKSTLDSFKLVSGLVDIEAKAEATEILDVEKVAGSATYTIRAYPAAITAKLGAFLQGYTLAGSELVATGEAAFRGADVDVKGDFKAKDAVVGGPQSATLKEVSAVYSVAANTKTLDATVRDLTLDCGSVDAAMADQSASVKGVLAKLSASKAGDEVTAKADVRVRTVNALAPQIKSAAVNEIVLECDVTANTKTFDADAKRLTVTIAGAEAWMKDAAKPVTMKATTIELNGTKRGDDLDLRKLDVRCPLANGGGALKIAGFGKEGMTASGRFDFRGDVAPLVDVVKVFMPDLKDATSSGSWTFVANVATSGKDIDVTPKLEVRKMAFAGYKDLTVQDADITFEAKARVNTDGDGRAVIESCSLTAPGATVKATGTAAGIFDPAKLTSAAHVDATLVPAELTKRLSAFLFGYKLDGSPVTAVADIGIEGTERYTAKGRATAPTVKVTMPAADPKAPARVVTQEAMVVEFDVTADIKKGAELVDIRRCTYESRTAKATAAGKVVGLEKMTANVAVTADAELAQVMKDFGAMFGLGDYDLQGRASAKFDLVGDAGRLKATGGATIDKFSVAVPDGKGGKATVTDPRITMTTEADVTTESMDVKLTDAKVACGFLNGTMSGSILKATTEREFKGLQGKFVYVPDKLGPVIQPWLMGGKLSGAEEQTVTFTLDGKAAEFDPLALLRASTGNASMQIGLFTMTGLAAKGGMDLKIAEQHAKTTTQLGVNGGVTDLTVDVDLRRNYQAVSTGSFKLKQVGANTQMAPLLKLIHPVFAVAEGALDGMIDGKIDCDLGLSFNAPLSMTMLREGWTSFPKHKINGTGHFEISGLKLNAAGGFLTELLKALEVADSREIEVNPLDFAIKDGRLSYARPMRMKLAGQPTTWTGTIGLDQTLDLVWRIPITEKLVKKYDFLKYWKGEELEVMVKGTATAPKLMWAEFIADATAKAAKKAIEEKGADLLEGLLGDKEAKKLLEQADALYDAGKKAEAAPLYREIHEKYRKTKTYDKHKDRIKARENP